MDRFIGALHIDTAELAHQQTGDQRRDRVGDFVGQHHRHHQRQAKQRVRRLRDGRRHFVHLGRQVEHDKVVGFGLQLTDRLPVADHQQDVAQLQRLVHQLAAQRLAVAADAHHVQIVAAAERRFAQAFAQQRRVRDQRHFGHADVARLFREVIAAQHHRLQPLLAAEFAQIDLAVRHVD